VTIRSWWTGPLFLLYALAACERSREKAHKAPETQTAVTAVRTARAGIASPSNATVGTSSVDSIGSNASAAGPSALASAEPTPEAVHCKALGKQGLLAIGLLHEELLELIVEGPNVMTFSHHQGLARVSLTQYRRDGATPFVIGRHTSRGDPKSPVLLKDAAYFTRNQVLYRMARDGGTTVEVAKGFANSIAVQGGFAYGVHCDAKAQKDQLNRVAITGGPIELVADIEHTTPAEQDPGTFACDYRSLVADEQAVYLGHWNGRRILRVALADRSVTTLATKTTYPQSLHLADDALYFQAQYGVYRSPKTKAEAVRVTELGSSPFTLVAYSPQGLFIHESGPYAPDEWTYGMSFATGKASKLEYFKALDPEETPPDTGVRDIAVDDECVYIARQYKGYLSLLARKRPW